MNWLKKILGKTEETSKTTESTKLTKHFVPDREKVFALLKDFIFIDAGTFIMGSSTTEKGRRDDEAQHTVTLDSFYLQETPVTQELWLEVMGENPSNDKIWKDLPITNVSWLDCQEFINRINELTGKEFRLPTEAEWEFAAKGATQSDSYIYSGSNHINEVAWYNENSGDRLHVVKELKPNELGLYDMSGNVWEWCADWYAPYRLDKKGNHNPKGPDSGCGHVLRGGSWDNSAHLCRCALRYFNSIEKSNDRTGFRLLKI